MPLNEMFGYSTALRSMTQVRRGGGAVGWCCSCVAGSGRQAGGLGARQQRAAGGPQRVAPTPAPARPLQGKGDGWSSSLLSVPRAPLERH